jgi:hypothetical protein
MLSSSSWRPHGESKLVQETPWNHDRRQGHNAFSKTASDSPQGDRNWTSMVGSGGSASPNM